MARFVAIKLVRNLLCVLLVALSFLSTRLVLGDAVAPRVPPVAVQAAESPVERLVGGHGCWTSDAPADMQGVVPGHVVVTVDGTTRHAGPRMVGKALSQLFEGVDHGLTVHAFCR